MTNVLQYLKKAVDECPDKTAVSMRDETYSFSEVDDLAARLAKAIPDGMKNQPVGVLVDRCPMTIIAFFSVLYSGNYYVPIDVDMPKKKIQAIIDDTSFRVILGSAESSKLLEELDYDNLILHFDDIPEARCEDPQTGGEDPVYMIYTSGSTGVPKGVIKSHNAVISFVEAFAETFPVKDTTVIGNQTPFFFDASAKDIYFMLRYRACLDVIPTELFAMPMKLIEYMNEKQISWICWVPTALSLIVQWNTFKHILPTHLEHVFFVGEAMQVKHLKKWIKALPDLRYVNLYGSTETAGICCYYEVTGSLDEVDSLPIGKALKNARLYLVDGEETIREPERIGEICIVSPALALGYYHDEERTRKSFLMKDFGEGEVRCFMTGDLARYDEYDNLVFAVRADAQIKHLGHRIELGEIETAASHMEEIDRCCCVYDDRRSRIVMFCSLVQNADRDERELRKMMGERLSSYMVPGVIRIMDQLPLNANGKTDRQKLKELI